MALSHRQKSADGGHDNWNNLRYDTYVFYVFSWFVNGNTLPRLLA